MNYLRFCCLKRSLFYHLFLKNFLATYKIVDLCNFKMALKGISSHFFRLAQILMRMSFLSLFLFMECVFILWMPSSDFLFIFEFQQCIMLLFFYLFTKILVGVFWTSCICSFMTLLFLENSHSISLNIFLLLWYVSVLVFYC